MAENIYEDDFAAAAVWCRDMFRLALAIHRKGSKHVHNMLNSMWIWILVVKDFGLSSYDTCSKWHNILHSYIILLKEARVTSQFNRVNWSGICSIMLKATPIPGHPYAYGTMMDGMNFLFKPSHRLVQAPFWDPNYVCHTMSCSWQLQVTTSLVCTAMCHCDSICLLHWHYHMNYRCTLRLSQYPPCLSKFVVNKTCDSVWMPPAVKPLIPESDPNQSWNIPEQEACDMDMRPWKQNCCCRSALFKRPTLCALSQRCLHAPLIKSDIAKLVTRRIFSQV